MCLRSVKSPPPVKVARLRLRCSQPTRRSVRHISFPSPVGRHMVEISRGGNMSTAPAWWLSAVRYRRGHRAGSRTLPGQIHCTSTGVVRARVRSTERTGSRQLPGRGAGGPSVCRRQVPQGWWPACPSPASTSPPASAVPAAHQRRLHRLRQPADGATGKPSRSAGAAAAMKNPQPEAWAAPATATRNRVKRGRRSPGATRAAR